MPGAGAFRLTAARDQHRADQIFTEALDRPPAGREAYIEAVCGDDVTLRDEVHELLQHYSSAEDALTQTRTTHRISGRPDIDRVDLQTDSERTIGTCRLDGRLEDDGFFERWATLRSSDRPAAVLWLARQRLTLDDARRVGVLAERLLRLDHPGLPRVLDAGTVDLGRGPEAFFLSERVQGDTVSGGPASSIAELRRRASRFLPLCDALQELHFQGLIHGRVSAQRVIETENGSYRLAEPGLLAALARAVPDSAAAERLAQNAGAPERPVLAPDSLDGRVDVHDLGAMLQAWCGDLRGPLPDRLRAIADRAMQHDRQHRYRAAGEVGDAVRPLLEPTSERGDGNAPMAAGMSPLTVAILAAIAAAAGFTLGAMLI